MTQTATHLQHVANVMVPVKDQDAAIAYYVDTLGFEPRADMPFGDGDRWVEVGLPGAETTVALCAERGEWTAGRMTGVTLATEDIDAVHARLSEAGADVDAEVSKFGAPVPPMFWFRDGDGNTLLIVEV
jgi:catechol 2,3-dioxygenase-like lactoylglutathione lyase family enzyme